MKIDRENMEEVKKETSKKNEISEIELLELLALPECPERLVLPECLELLGFQKVVAFQWPTKVEKKVKNIFCKVCGCMVSMWCPSNKN